jgi:hypothetical protein
VENPALDLTDPVLGNLHQTVSWKGLRIVGIYRSGNPALPIRAWFAKIGETPWVIDWFNIETLAAEVERRF